MPNATALSLLKSQAAPEVSLDNHQEIVTRLAAFLKRAGRLTWKNLRFITQAVPESETWVIRTTQPALCPDVFAISPTSVSAEANPCVYEVVTNRSEFLAQMAQISQRTAYESFCDGVYFVAPANVISPIELPSKYGLLTADATGGFTLVREPAMEKLQVREWPVMFIESNRQEQTARAQGLAVA